MHSAKRSDRVVACKSEMVARATAELEQAVAEEVSIEDPINVEEAFTELVAKATAVEPPEAIEPPKPPKSRKRKAEANSDS